MYKFTVFTPTYNRAYTLHRVYESLSAQTFKDFEWLIVDDGSSDNTSELVQMWQKSANFLIRFVYQENKGKHWAFNKGVQLAQGELFLPFDSDDACTHDTLETFDDYWETISNKPAFSGATCLTMDETGKIQGDKFSNGEYIDASPLIINYSYKIRGEKWGFHKTNLLRQFPFPEFEGEKFIAEMIVWNRIALQYKTRFINKALRIYQSHREDSLTARILNIRLQSPQGTKLCYQEFSRLPIPYLSRLRGIINYLRFSLHAGDKLTDILKSKHYHINYLLACLPAYLLFKRDITQLTKLM